MARDDQMVMDLRLRLDKAEKDLARFVKKAERTQLNLKGIDHRKFTQPLGKITGSVTEFQKSLDASNARVIAFTASAGILMGVTRAFQEMARATVEVERTLTDINVIMGASTRNLQKFGAELFNVASQTGQSFFEVGKAATEFARQGLSMEKTLIRTRDALILTRLSGMDAAESVNALTAAINSFSSSALTSTQIINRLANVDAAFAVSTNDLAEAIRRVGSSADSVNVTFNEMVAIVTSVQQTTARGGNVIGNSLKTIFTRIQRTEVINQMKRLGVEVKDLQGNMKPAMQVLQEFAKTYDTLNPQLKASTAELIGGVYQMNILKAILKDLKSDYSVYSNALDVANKSTDEAIKRNAELNKTLSALINESIQNLTQVGAEIGKLSFEPLFRRILEGFNALKKDFTLFGDVSELLGFSKEDGQKFGGELAQNILKSFGNILSGPGFIALGTIIGKLFLDFVKFLGQSVKDFANLNRNAQKQQVLQEQIKNTLAANPALVDSIIRKEQTREQVEKRILDALKQEILLRQQIDKLAQGSGFRAQAQGFSAKIDKSSGESQVTYTGKRKFLGHIPNFADMSEYMGALAGGYKPGDIKKTFIPNYGTVTYNTAEQVKQFPGMSQQAIIPPEDSKAGKNYKKDFIGQHGFDPYASKGFIPNLMQVLTSMRTIFDRKGAGSTGRMGNILSASKEQLVKSQGVPSWLKGVLDSALSPGETVRIRTMGQLSPITESERAKFGGAGRGYAAHLKGAEMEKVVAGRAGNFSFSQRFARPGGTGQLGKMPVDLGTTSKTGRAYPVESKPELKTKQIGQIFLKTLYETNSSSLKQLVRRLKSKADAGDPVAAAQLDKLQDTVTRGISARGTELAKYTAGDVKSLEQFNASIGFDTRNAMAAIREQRAGTNVFSRGFIPNFDKGKLRDERARVGLLLPPGKRGKKYYDAPVKGSRSQKGGMRKYRINAFEPNIPDQVIDSLEDKVRDEMERVATEYANQFRNNPLNADPDVSKYFNAGAMGAATGAVFEAAMDAAFQKSVDKQTATWDVNTTTGNVKNAIAVMNQFGAEGLIVGDYKNSDSRANLESMAHKIETEFYPQYANLDKKTKKTARGASAGFIPNFSPLTDALKTEAAMGGEPVLDYNPKVGLYVRDGKTQKDFGDVMRDHPEGLNAAIKNSKSMQDKVAADGHIPNFQGTGFDATVITGSLGLLAFAANDLRNNFKDLKEEGATLEKELNERVETEKKAIEAAKKAKQEAEKARSQKAPSDADIQAKRGELATKREANEISARKKADEDFKKQFGATTKKGEDRKLDAQGNLSRSAMGKEQRAEYDKFLKKARTTRERNTKALREEIVELQQSKRAKANNVRKTKEAARAAGKNAGEARKLAQAQRNLARKYNKEQAGVRGQIGGADVRSQGGRGGRMARTMQTMGPGLMMAAPMIGGIGRQLAGDNQTAQGVIGGLETAGSMAAMGAMFGPQGAAVGAVAGGIMGIAQAAGVAKDPMKQLETNLQNATEKLTNFNNSTQSYLMALDAFEASLTDPNMSGEDRVKRQDALQDAFMTLPDDVKAKFKDAAMSVEDMKKTFADMQKDLQQEQRIAERAKAFEGEMDEERGWFVNASRSVFNALGGNVQAADDVFDDSKDGKRRLQSFTGSILREIDTGKLKGDEGLEKLNRINELVNNMGDKANSAEIAVLSQHLEDLGVPEEYIDQLERVNKNQFDGAKASRKLADELNDARKGIDNLNKSIEHTNRLSRINNAFIRTIQQMESQTKITNVILKQNLEIEKQRIATINKSKAFRKESRVNYAIAAMEGFRPNVDPFLGGVEKNRLDFDIKSRRQEADRLKSLREVITKSTTSAFEISQKEFIKATDQIAQQLAGSADTEQKQQKLLDDIAKNQKLQTMLAPIMEKHLKEIKDNPESFVDDPQRTRDIVNALKDGGVNNAELIGARIGSELRGLQSQTAGKLQEIIEQGRMQEILLKQQQQFAEQGVRLQERIASFGGPQGGLGDRGPSGLSSNIEKLQKSFDKFALSQYGTNQNNAMIDQGAAAFSTLDFLINNMNLREGGVGGKGLTPKAFQPLISRAYAGRTLDIQQQLTEAEDITRIQMGGKLPKDLKDAFEAAQGQADDVALEQIASQLKLQDLPENVRVMRQQQAVAVEILRSQSGSLVEKNKMAFSAALKGAGLNISNIGEVMQLSAKANKQGQDHIEDATKDVGETVKDSTRDQLRASAQLSVHAIKQQAGLDEGRQRRVVEANAANIKKSDDRQIANRDKFKNLFGTNSTQQVDNIFAVEGVNREGFGLVAKSINDLRVFQERIRNAASDKKILEEIAAKKFRAGENSLLNQIDIDDQGKVTGLDKLTIGGIPFREIIKEKNPQKMLEESYATAAGPNQVMAAIVRNRPTDLPTDLNRARKSALTDLSVPRRAGGELSRMRGFADELFSLGGKGDATKPQEILDFISNQGNKQAIQAAFEARAATLGYEQKDGTITGATNPNLTTSDRKNQIRMMLRLARIMEKASTKVVDRQKLGPNDGPEGTAIRTRIDLTVPTADPFSIEGSAELIDLLKRLSPEIKGGTSKVNAPKGGPLLAPFAPAGPRAFNMFEFLNNTGYASMADAAISHSPTDEDYRQALGMDKDGGYLYDKLSDKEKTDLELKRQDLIKDIQMGASKEERNLEALLSARYEQNISKLLGDPQTRANSQLFLGDPRQYMMGQSDLGFNTRIFNKDGQVLPDVLGKNKAQAQNLLDIAKGGDVNDIFNTVYGLDTSDPKKMKQLELELQTFLNSLDFIDKNSKTSQEMVRAKVELQKAVKDNKVLAKLFKTEEQTAQKANENARSKHKNSIDRLTRDIEFLKERQRLEKLSIDEENLLKKKQRERTVAKYNRGEGSFDDSLTDLANGFKYSADQMAADADVALQGLGQTFRSEATSAFKALIDGTKSSKQAFGDLFNSIGNMAQEKIIEMAVNRYVFNPIGNLFGGKSGGVVSNDGIKRFSVGGAVTGGSGVRDDVPALLSKGEYVIKKGSVNKYGMSFLNSLNSGEVPASDSPDPQANLNSLVSSVQSNKGAYAKFNLRNAFVYDSDKPGAGSSYAIDSRLSRQALTDPDNPRNEFRMNKVAKLYDYWAQRRQEIADWREAVDTWRTQKRKKMQNSLWMFGGMALAGSLFGGSAGSTFGGENNLWSRGKSGFSNWWRNRGGGGGANPIGVTEGTTYSGPRIPMSKGGHQNRDNIPAMLMGGEYVINADSVRKYGVDFFHHLNSGRLRKMATGGYVGSESMPEVSGSATGESGAMNNNITINVNIDQNGDVTSDNSMSPERAQQLAALIENQITTTLVKEKRQGGILHN